MFKETYIYSTVGGMRIEIKALNKMDEKLSEEVQILKKMSSYFQGFTGFLDENVEKKNFRRKK